MIQILVPSSHPVLNRLEVLKENKGYKKVLQMYQKIRIRQEQTRREKAKEIMRKTRLSIPLKKVMRAVESYQVRAMLYLRCL